MFTKILTANCAGIAFPAPFPSLRAAAGRAAIQSGVRGGSGLLRRFAPRNDGVIVAAVLRLLGHNLPPAGDDAEPTE